MTTHDHLWPRQPAQVALETEKLLARYPDLSERELTRLVGIYPYVPVLDVGLMLADDDLSQKLTAFERDHAEKLHAPVSLLVAALTIPALLAAVLLWSIWNQAGGL